MNARRSRLLVVGIALAAVTAFALTACAGSGQSGSGSGSTGGFPASANTIAEQDKAFSPASLTVKAGDVVTFANQDTVPHDVVVGDQDLGRQDPGQGVTWTAAKDGSFAFRCRIHPSMTGQIVVGAGGGAATPPASGSAPGGSTSIPGGGGSSGGGSGGYSY